MRFSAATVALFASLVAAIPQDVETVYSTEDVTVVSCAPTVTNCPGTLHATSTPEAVAAATTGGAEGVSPVGVTSAVPEAPSATPAAGSSPAGGAGAGVVPSGAAPSGAAPSAVPSGAAAVGGGAGTTAAPQVTVIPVTTCVPTVIMSTSTIGGGSGAGAYGSGYPSGKPAKSSSPVIPSGAGAYGSGYPSGSAT